ncbi:hypothetical protein VSU19_21555 [Verrucomicrobiales bacterium BCK34]|nr:hypothetical protein [Verrucomicrobiales bacterium BCK34]
MINVSIAGFIGWGILILLSIMAGTALSRHFPWSIRSRAAGVPLGVGIALAPFLSGLATVAALAVFRGASHAIHAVIVVALLLVIVVVSKIKTVGFESRICREKPGQAFYLLMGLWGLWGGVLVYGAMFYPLTQNDALEYATVGRILYETGDLLSYPVIKPDLNDAGFYGPWTHPPLYVALIYLGNVIQGHADSPGLMRLVGPWVALSAAYLTYCLGCLRSRMEGVIAAVVLLSTPLFFLGADSGLIDSLPVLGFLLILAVLAGVREGARLRGILLGLMAGGALWTHSQAILFVPMCFVVMACQQVVRRRLVWREFLGFGLGVGIVALAPYLRNVFLFGSPVSDNPAVFALQLLAWDDYFQYARGLDQTIAKIQYGLFKGWSSPEAFGLSFWFMIIGVSVLLLGAKRYGVRILKDRQKELPVICVLFLLMYHMGVLLSILLRVDLIIKNERYILGLLPAVALLAGFGLFSLARAKGAIVYRGVILLLLIGWTFQLGALAWYRFSSSRIGISELLQSHDLKLLSRPEYEAIDYLRDETAEDEVVFTMKPSDMYYSRRRMLSYLDPEMISFYETEDPNDALGWLLEHNISLIHLPPYGLPPFYNSVLLELVGDPSLSELVFSSGGSQVYRLRKERKETLVSSADDELAGDWKRRANLVIGGRKALAGVSTGETSLTLGEVSRGGMIGGLFHRDASVFLESPWRRGEGECGVRLELKGRGMVRIWIEEDGAELPRFLFGEVVVTEGESKQWMRRWLLGKGSKKWRVLVEHMGTSEIQIITAVDYL